MKLWVHWIWVPRVHAPLYFYVCGQTGHKKLCICLFVWFVKSWGHVRTVSYLTKLFLDKPPGDSLPVLNAHSFASNWQLALLESTEEGNYFSTKECAGREDWSRNPCLRSGYATGSTELPCPDKNMYTQIYCSDQGCTVCHSCGYGGDFTTVKLICLNPKMKSAIFGVWSYILPLEHLNLVY